MARILNENEIDKLINLPEDEFLKIIEIPDGYDSEVEGEDDVDVGHQDEILRNAQELANDPAEEIVILLDAAAQQLVQLEVVNPERNENIVLAAAAEAVDENEEAENVTVNRPGDITDPHEAEKLRQFHRRTASQNWKFRKTEFIPPNTEWLGSLPPPPVDELTPLQYFKSLFTDELINHIVEQTGIYAMQKDGVELNCSTNEMEEFLGILLYMGICKMPSIRLYWSNECRFPPIANVMSRNRFLQLIKYFHLNNNENMPPRTDPNRDKLYKIRPMLMSLRTELNAIPPEEFNAVDEQIIPFKGRNVLKQYIRNKPHKWGFKVFTRAGSSGIMYDFEVYVGKNTGDDYGLGFSGDIVLTLCSTLAENKNFKIFADNWFTSLSLAVALKERGLFFVGTVKNNRMSKCVLKSEAELKALGRGSFDWRIEKNHNIALVRWFDRKSINFVSSYTAVEVVGQCRRYSGAEKKFINIARPQIVAEYNKYMGGVDLIDMLLELYRVDIRSRKWYMRIVFWCLGVAVTNSWLLYRRHQKQRGKIQELSLVQFQSHIASALTMMGKTQPKKRGRPGKESPGVSPLVAKRFAVTPVVDVRLDGVGHLPNMVEKKGRCKKCIKSTTQIICIKCNVNLCLTTGRNCFMDFHTKK